MKFVSQFALGIALTFGTAAISSPAIAQKKEEKPAEKRQIKVNKQEQELLIPIQKAVNAKDWAAASAALPAAQAAAARPEMKYYLGYLQYQAGNGLGDKAMQKQGLETLLSSDLLEPTERAKIYRSLAAIAVQEKDYVKVEEAFTKIAEIQPNDTEVLNTLAKVKLQLKKTEEALPLFDRVAAAARAAGQKPDEMWYKLRLQNALDRKDAQQSLKIGQELLADYPTAQNFKDALRVYYATANLEGDKAILIDYMRLMRSADALVSEREYFDYLTALEGAGLVGEVKAVLEEGINANKVSGGKPVFQSMMKGAVSRIADDRAGLPGYEAKAKAAATGTVALNTADAYFAYGDYAKAADLYRLALQKGAVDSNLVNTRLGASLALAGRKAEAEAAFKAVSGARQNVASFWLLWLAQRG